LWDLSYIAGAPFGVGSWFPGAKRRLQKEEKAKIANAHGVVSMREPAGALGGEFDRARPAVSRGTVIEITLPVEKEKVSWRPAVAAPTRRDGRRSQPTRPTRLA
jgi:hypothetical protein